MKPVVLCMTYNSQLCRAIACGQRKAPLPPSGYSPNKLGKMGIIKSFPNLLGKCPKGDGGLSWSYAIALPTRVQKASTQTPVWIAP